MEWGLKLMLATGFVLNLILGFTISWFVVDYLGRSDRIAWISSRGGALKTLLFLFLGMVATVVAFALSIVIVWPPHFP